MQESPFPPTRPDRVFDGGELDCGSGLALLIRENMLQVPLGGILELRSREPTVADELPPWCRMSGHELLGSLPGEGGRHYFIRRGTGAPGGAAGEAEGLERDKARAKDFEWRARVRARGTLHTTVYCRNFSFEVGQPASFEEKDRYPSALEYLLGALGGDLSASFAHQCLRSGLAVDDIEITLRATLINVLAQMGLEEGDPGLRRLEVKCFASTFAPEAQVREAWEQAAARSPLVSTLRKAAEVELKLAIV